MLTSGNAEIKEAARKRSGSRCPEDGRPEATLSWTVSNSSSKPEVATGNFLLCSYKSLAGSNGHVKCTKVEPINMWSLTPTKITEYITLCVVQILVLQQ